MTYLGFEPNLPRQEARTSITRPSGFEIAFYFSSISNSNLLDIGQTLPRVCDLKLPQKIQSLLSKIDFH